MKGDNVSRRKPIAELKMHGAYREDRHGKKTLRFTPGATAPKYLSKVARQEWNRVAPLLEEQGVLQNIDQSLLASYCQMYGHWRASEDDIAKNGLVIMVSSQTRTGRTDKPIPNPAVTNSIRFHRAMVAMAVKFGINPLDRPRIEVPKEEEEEDDTDLMNWVDSDGDNGL
jgi:P27 family predicted phage terminase small subunit